MNRQERRRLYKKSFKEPVINLKRQDVSLIKESVPDNGVEIAFKLILSIPVMVLKDKFGYGKKRLERFINEVLNLYDSYNKGYVELEDLFKTLEEETGITFEEE